MVRAVRSLVLLWLAAFAVACGSSSDGDSGKGTGRASIVSFEATPSTVQKGQRSILSWVVEGAIRIELHDDVGAVVENATPKGTHTVEPEEATTYRLLATGKDGVEVERELTVQVASGEGPTITLAAEPERIAFGSKATLTWASSDAERVILKAGEETLVDTAENLSGSLEVKPTTSTIYQITAIGPGGEASAAAQVEVEPVIHAFGGTFSERVAVGDSIGLSWETSGAEALTLRTPEGFSLEIAGDKIARGSTIVTVDESGLFELIATSGTVEVKATFEVPLLGKPMITDLEAAPGTLTRGVATQVTISWAVDGATEASLFLGTEERSIVPSQVAEGSMTVALSDATTIRLEARNREGTTSRSIEVEAVEGPAIASFAAIPSRVGAGESFVVRWDVSNAVTLSLFKDGEPVFVDSEELSGERIQQIDVDSTYRLVATNSLGDSVSTELQVAVGSPIIESFKTGSGRYGPDSEITFAWKVAGGSQLRLLDGSDEPIAGCSFANSESGSCTTTGPSELGSHTFVLEVENGAGIERAEVSVLITDGPWIDAFTVTPTRLNQGGTVRFSWDVLEDLAGASPVLSLGSDSGLVVDVTGADSRKGFVDVVMDRAGNHSFTLTASTEKTVASTATASVEVVALPVLEAAPNQPTFQPMVDTEIRIEWVTSDATTLVIHTVDALGNIGAQPVYVAAGDDIADGSWSVVPGPTNRHWRVIAKNELGATVSADIEIEVLDPPPAISSFQASATTVAPGTTVTLSWTTTGGTTLSPILGNGPTPLSGAGSQYIPLSQGATNVSLHDCGSGWEEEDGCAIFSFPGGFGFPFDGKRHTAAQIFVNGALGFDTSVADRDETSTPASLPSSSYRFIHLAPFWTDLLCEDRDSLRYELKGEGVGRHLAIQWNCQDTDGYDRYRFQVVLWEHGAFDFRYDTMYHQWFTTAMPNSVIGFQNMNASKAHMFKDGAADDIDGDDLAGLSLRYLQANETAVGQREVVVDRTTIFTLCADGFQGRDCQSVTVTVQ